MCRNIDTENKTSFLANMEHTKHTHSIVYQMLKSSEYSIAFFRFRNFEFVTQNFLGNK